MPKKQLKKNNNKNKNKNLNLLRIIFIVIAIVFIVSAFNLYNTIKNTKYFSEKYLIPIAIVEGIIVLLIVIGLTKKHKKLKINIICLMLAIILSAGSIYANMHINDLLKLIKNMINNSPEIEEYYVIVNNDSLYTKIEDMKGKDIYTFNLESDIKDIIQKKVMAAIIDGDSVVEIGQSLIDKKIDAIAVSSVYYVELDEQIEGFKESTKIIDTETKEIQVEESIEDENSNFKIGNGVFNVYLSGIDVYGNINKVSRTDSNMVATVNMNTHEILLTSIPRDYYVTLHKYKAKDKLTHSGIYGINETVNTVEDFLGIDINYYLRVNFTTLINLIDILDGVDVYSDYDFSCKGYDRPYRFQKGYNHISDGYTAMVFCRERNAFLEGDNQRIKNQQHVLEGIINKISNSDTILRKYTKILESLSGCFNTNVSSDDIANLVRAQLDSMPKWSVKTISLTGSGASRTTYSMGNQELYVTIPNQKSINDAKAQIEELMNKR